MDEEIEERERETQWLLETKYKEIYSHRNQHLETQSIPQFQYYTLSIFTSHKGTQQTHTSDCDIGIYYDHGRFCKKGQTPKKQANACKKEVYQQSSQREFGHYVLEWEND